HVASPAGPRCGVFLTVAAKIARDDQSKKVANGNSAFYFQDDAGPQRSLLLRQGGRSRWICPRRSRPWHPEIKAQPSHPAIGRPARRPPAQQVIPPLLRDGN